MLPHTTVSYAHQLHAHLNALRSSQTNQNDERTGLKRQEHLKAETLVLTPLNRQTQALQTARSDQVVLYQAVRMYELWEPSTP